MTNFVVLVCTCAFVCVIAAMGFIAFVFVSLYRDEADEFALAGDSEELWQSQDTDR